MSTAPRFDPRELRNALGTFTTGVTIITARAADGSPVGLTANSFSSVSLDPPMVLWSLAKTARSLDAFEAAEHWAVHILSAQQEALSNRFAKAGAEKFSGIEQRRGHGGAPLLEGCTARLQCKTAFKYEGGDHLIFVGEVLEFDRCDVPPLVFQAGKYAVATRKTDSVSTAVPARRGTSWSEDHVAYLLGRAYFQIYGRIREHARQQGLSDVEYFTLATLMIRDGVSVQQLNAVFSYSGCEASPATVQALAARGLLGLSGEGLETVCRLTEQGRALTLRTIAAAEAIEVDTMAAFGVWDGLSLKNLLRQLIRQTDPGVPDLWA